MSPIPRPRAVAPGEGKTIMLFAVRFDDGGLERTYGVKLSWSACAKGRP
jgi:hypothetical protein